MPAVLPEADVGWQSHPDNPVSFLVWRLVHAGIRSFTAATHMSTVKRWYYSRRGLPSWWAWIRRRHCGYITAHPCLSHAVSARVLRTSRPCRPCHGMCCAAGEGVCTYVPSEERGPRGTGLREVPHAARYEAMLRVIHPRAPKPHRVGGDHLARAGLAGFSYGPAPTCQQRLAPSPASPCPRPRAKKSAFYQAIGYGHVGTSPRASWRKRCAPSPPGVRLGTENAVFSGERTNKPRAFACKLPVEYGQGLDLAPDRGCLVTGRQSAVTCREDLE